MIDIQLRMNFGHIGCCRFPKVFIRFKLNVINFNNFNYKFNSFHQKNIIKRINVVFHITISIVRNFSKKIEVSHNMYWADIKKVDYLIIFSNYFQQGVLNPIRRNFVRKNLCLSCFLFIFVSCLLVFNFCFLCWWIFNFCMNFLNNFFQFLCDIYFIICIFIHIYQRSVQLRILLINVFFFDIDISYQFFHTTLQSKAVAHFFSTKFLLLGNFRYPLFGLQICIIWRYFTLTHYEITSAYLLLFEKQVFKSQVVVYGNFCCQSSIKWYRMFYNWLWFSFNYTSTSWFADWLFDQN